MFDYGSIDDLLKSTEHMEILRNNSLQDDGTDTVKGVDWFQYKGKQPLLFTSAATPGSALVRIRSS